MRARLSLADVAVELLLSCEDGRALIARDAVRLAFYEDWPELAALASALDKERPGWRHLAQRRVRAIERRERRAYEPGPASG